MLTRPIARLALTCLLAAGCGENGGAGLDASTADASPPDAPPSACTDLDDPAPTGQLVSPADLPPLSGCAPAAFHEMESTIYFVKGAELDAFSYAYPRISNSCTTGLRINSFPYTWSDGTVGFARRSIMFETFESTSAVAFCFAANGELVYTSRRCFKDGDAPAECDDGLVGSGPVYPALGELAREVTLVGADSFAYGAYDVDVKGDVAYVATDAGIRAYDLSDPNGLALLGEVVLPDTFVINDIEVLESGAARYAYLSAFETVIVDVTDPTAMTPIAIIDVSGRDPYSHTLQISRRSGTPYLYLGGQAGIPVYDLTSPTAPQYVTTIPLSMEGTHDMTIDGDTIYVNNEFNGFVAIDVTDFDDPVELARVPGDYYHHASSVGVAGTRRLVVEGGEGLEEDGRGTHLRVLDGQPGSPTYMQVLGQYATRAETGIHNMIVRDGFVYIAYYHDGLRVVDLRDPTNPTEVGHYNTWDRATSNGGPFDGAIGVDLAADGSVVLVNYGGSVMRLRPTLPP